MSSGCGRGVDFVADNTGESRGVGTAEESGEAPREAAGVEKADIVRDESKMILLDEAGLCVLLKSLVEVMMYLASQVNKGDE